MKGDFNMLHPSYFEYPLENPQSSVASAIAMGILIFALAIWYFGYFGKGDK